MRHFDAGIAPAHTSFSDGRPAGTARRTCPVPLRWARTRHSSAWGGRCRRLVRVRRGTRGPTRDSRRWASSHSCPTGPARTLANCASPCTGRSGPSGGSRLGARRPRGQGRAPRGAYAPSQSLAHGCGGTRPPAIARLHTARARLAASARSSPPTSCRHVQNVTRRPSHPWAVGGTPFSGGTTGAPAACNSAAKPAPQCPSHQLVGGCEPRSGETGSGRIHVHGGGARDASPHARQRPKGWRPPTRLYLQDPRLESRRRVALLAGLAGWLGRIGKRHGGRAETAENGR
jgi:hypothetical protein